MSQNPNVENAPAATILNDLCAHVVAKLREIEEEESSVSQYVRKLFSSKQRPSRFIKGLLENHHQNCSSPMLQDASQNLISGHISLLSTENSFLSFIKPVSVSIFFIQVILESIDKVGEKAAIQLTTMVMQALQKNILDCVLREKKENVAINCGDHGAESEMPNELSLSAFYIGALLRAINPYASSLPMLLSPLWKNISSFISNDINLSAELMENAVLALLTYLEEGERTCLDSGAKVVTKPNIENAQNLQGYLFHNKVLGFLLTRLAAILPFYISSADENFDSSLLDKVFAIVIRIHGLPQAMEVSLSKNKISESNIPVPQILQSFAMLEQKADQCIISSCIRGDALIKESIIALLEAKIPESTKTSFEIYCWKFGKLGVLLTVLKQAPTLPMHAELLVVTAEQILFSLLPQCHCIETQPQVASQVVASSTCATLLLATTSQSKIVNALLLKWLDRSCTHPVSREAVVSLVYNHVVELSVAYGAQSPRSALDTKENDCSAIRPLICLMINLFLDHRSNASHRDAIGGVLSRLLVTKNCNVYKYVQCELSIQVIAFVNKLRNALRKGKGEPHATNHGTLGLSDWICILRVVEMIDFSANDCLKNEVTSMMQEIQASHEPISHKVFQLGYRAPHYIAVILCTDIQEGSYPQVITRWFLREAKRRKVGTLLTHEGTILTYALLQYLGQRAASNQVDDALGPIVKSLSWTIQQARQLIINHMEGPGSSLTLAAGSLLGNLGPTIIPSTQSEILRGISECFNDLFALEHGMISANTMTCLLRFASTLRSHQEILPKCLPSSLQGWFKCRLKGSLHSTFKKTNLESAQAACKQQALAKIEKESNAIKESPFDSMSLNVLPHGSYFISMPTLEGRSALVIFPPGDQSLEDIQYMLQKDSLDGEDIRCLKHVGVIENGNGCQLFSSKYK